MFSKAESIFEDILTEFASDKGGLSSAYMDIPAMDAMKLVKEMNLFDTVKKKDGDGNADTQKAKPVRLGKNEKCPVCNHRSVQAYAYLGEGGANEHKNTCNKCGFTETSLVGDSEIVMELEEFIWTFVWTDEDADTEKKVAEQKRVIELYKKIWNNSPLTEEEETELNTIAASQPKRVEMSW